ncbi:uncharacterized protein LOC113350675 [Papaver somniferum]|uniref:uncharacterized protein LOC113350675 n=1 Tax=Papaver somniferum TaxID=3469 RepID=UPI000E7040C6|nr:uncharacterized protein LOC113350675 [Papaver somniferum]
MEFAFNTSLNRLTGKTPFEIVYSKVPNHVLDLVVLPKISKANVRADKMIDKDAKIHQEMKTKLEDSNENYKAIADEHRRFKAFQLGDLVMIHLRKERFPTVNHSPKWKLADLEVAPCPPNVKSELVVAADLRAEQEEGDYSYMTYNDPDDCLEEDPEENSESDTEEDPEEEMDDDECEDSDESDI